MPTPPAWRADAGDADDLVAALQDHRHACQRSERASDRDPPVRRQPRQLDYQRHPRLEVPASSKAIVLRPVTPAPGHLRRRTSPPTSLQTRRSYAPYSTTSPLRTHGRGSNLADSTLMELTVNGQLILAGGSGNGYRRPGSGETRAPLSDRQLAIRARQDVANSFHRQDAAWAPEAHAPVVTPITPFALPPAAPPEKLHCFQ